MKKLELLLQNKLEQIAKIGATRSLTHNPNYIDFSSNDYLGLALNKELNEITTQKLSIINHKINGSGGSRLISGHHEYITAIEEKIAKIHSAEACLLFNSGYNANMGVLSSIPQKNDIVLYDEYSHSSIKDGIRLSLANKFPFRHNNLQDLANKLLKFSNHTCFVVVESVYSMDGDRAPLVELVALCKLYDAILIVDEAHSTGVFGIGGNGLVCALGLEADIPIRIHTYGKAMGTHGASVVGSKYLKDYLINFSRQFIYTTALPLHSYVAIEVAYEYLSVNYKTLQAKLFANIDLLKSELTNVEVIAYGSPIICKLYPGNQQVKNKAKYLQSHLLDIKAILSPTVPIGKERIRICIHTFNSEKEIKLLTELL